MKNTVCMTSTRPSVNTDQGNVMLWANNAPISNNAIAFGDIAGKLWMKRLR
ncbi:MAG: hypothetical protein MI748_21185 [Opitutales bacterium]|nr:hypothetical protein [Opitutales bacterium]